MTNSRAGATEASCCRAQKLAVANSQQRTQTNANECSELLHLKCQCAVWQLMLPLSSWNNAQIIW